jgi:hypothetical protein
MYTQPHTQVPETPHQIQVHLPNPRALVCKHIIIGRSGINQLPSHHGQTFWVSTAQSQIILFFFFLMILGFELRASCLLGKHYATPPALCVLVIFEIGFHFMPRLAWTAIFLSVLLCMAGMMGTHHCTQPLVEMESQELFTWAGLEMQSLQSLPPT